MPKTAPDPASLENLHDIVGLDPVPLWPLAPGWYGVGGILVVGLVFFIWSWIHRWRANRYRRVALAELTQLEAAVHDASRRVSALAELPALVKRVALAAWPREVVASLSSQSLLEF